ncbi:hypothetical protein Bhyg_07447 [Pseudolycoriella hygida]|uniref:Uncharacterized protein n=1 Tax=Pseudolycoriella hygida TaxID=35572 RepID=A0A9Q0N324_9DIPT|nr:hypothetical protein Bhyg_07447 [Pseudolycoriella hygida]
MFPIVNSRGDYSTHHYGLDDYGARCGVSYYNLDIGFDKSDKENISEVVEAKLENEGEKSTVLPKTTNSFKNR